MHAALRTLALPFAWLLGACFPPPLQDCTDTGCPGTGPGTTGLDPSIPTSSGEGGVQTVTGDAPTTEAPDTSGGSTTAGDEPDPVIVDVELDPNPIKQNGLIAVVAEADHALGVRMELDNGDVVELASAGLGSFTGHVPAFTALINGPHSVLLTPWRPKLDGEPVDAPYYIDLPEPGSQGFWETGDPVGEGNVAALDLLPDDDLVEYGTYFEQGEPRCYLRRRDPDGAWSPADFVPLLPNSYCIAVDLKIDPELGTLRLLAYRKSGDDLRWWLGEISSWGKGAKQIGLGEIGEKAEALAQRPGLLAVCGAREAVTLDLDAGAWLFRPNEPVEPRFFDYWPGPKLDPHSLQETARDCVFAGDTLVLVGEAFGNHALQDPERERRFILEHDTTVAGSATWTVGGAGPGTQSRALAIDLDEEGHYLLAGYSCDDTCEPDGEVRIHLPGGALEWQASLGPLGTSTAGPHDIAWSPAGYLVVALAQPDGQTLRFNVQAFSPASEEPLWSYVPAEMQGLQIAVALAVGAFGEIYAGGIGDGPAVAVIPG
jgi:hypothetical protein